MLQDKLSALRAAKKSEDRGFTLIELLVVVVIIGILIAIAIPLYLNYEHGAKDKSAESDLRGAITAVQQCYSDNDNAYPASADVSGGADADMTFTCGSDTETATVSSGTTLTYTPVGSGPDSFQLTATNSGGSGKTFDYDSTSGSITTS